MYNRWLAEDQAPKYACDPLPLGHPTPAPGYGPWRRLPTSSPSAEAIKRIYNLNNPMYNRRLAEAQAPSYVSDFLRQQRQPHKKPTTLHRPNNRRYQHNHSPQRKETGVTGKIHSFLKKNYRFFFGAHNAKRRK